MIKRSTNRISKIRRLSSGAFSFLPLKPSLINFSCGLTADHFLISLAVPGLKLISEGEGKAGFTSNSEEMGEMSLAHSVLSRKVYAARGIQNMSSTKVYGGRGLGGGVRRL